MRGKSENRSKDLKMKNRLLSIPGQSTFVLLLIPAFFWPTSLLAQETDAADSVVSTPETVRQEAPPEVMGYGYDQDPGPAGDRWLFFGHINGYYTRSDQKGDNTVSGGGFNGMLAPAYRINNRLMVSLLYDGEYYKKRDYYSDKVGPRLRTEHQRHTGTAMLRYRFGPENRLSIRPLIFHTRTYNKDVTGDGWNDGLYNYRDKGGGLDFDYRRRPLGVAGGVYQCGIQYYQRKYPNFTSLLDLATGLGIEKDERDYRGTLFRAGYISSHEKTLRWAADYYVLHNRLDDKKVVRSDGVLSSKEQRDYLHSLSLRFSFFPAANDILRLGLDLNTSFNRSNQNYYDGMGTINLADDVFLDNYYDYSSYRIRPNLTYTLSRLPLEANLAYSLQRVDYRGRKAQDTDGSYKNSKQYETQQGVTVRLSWFFLKQLTAYLQWDYLDVNSNNDDERIYHYDHTVQNWQAGLSYTF